MFRLLHYSTPMADVRPASKRDRPGMLRVWARSVRATHHFLPLDWVDEWTDAVASMLEGDVRLFVIRGRGGAVKAFLGEMEGQVEMLFVDPTSFRLGIGSKLLRYAVEVLGAERVTVNEQNPEAVAFYERHGFRVMSRSEEDGLGNPFPLLHMSL